MASAVDPPKVQTTPRALRKQPALKVDPQSHRLQTDHTASVLKDRAGPPQVKDTEPSGRCRIWAFLCHQGHFW